MSRRFLSALTALALAVSLASSRAAESVWSGLVMANNVPQPTPIPAELKGLEGTLKGLFGYNQYQIIGQSRQTLTTGNEDWQAKSKYFLLEVDSKTGSKGNYTLNLQLFQEQKLLLETEAKLTKNRPFVIRGPQVGEGQLVMLLFVE